MLKNQQIIHLDWLCCPVSHRPLVFNDNKLITDDGVHKYEISNSGIPLFATEYISNETARQKEHYDKVAEKYIENLSYPHTEEYNKYLDKVFNEYFKDADLSSIAEICCGQGEVLAFVGTNNVSGLGIDISTNMLEAALQKHREHNSFMFVQGDATKQPILDDKFSTVVMLGGIHHVPNREALFSEIFRILKPGGKFYFREPVSDFYLWKFLRAIIYRLSPALDADTERPLVWKETVPLLVNKGFKLIAWRTAGFLGFCIFMNSDVLIFNRLFRFIPGIRFITKFAALFDELLLKMPGLGRAGLQVIGVAQKPFKDLS